MLLWRAVESARRFVVVVLLASIPAPLAAADSRIAFNLLTQHGTSFTERDIAGLPTALFFGFTFCPDICPSTLMELTTDLEALGADGDRIKVVFVSIDPDRDTQAHLKEYMTSFDQRIIAVSGSPESIVAIARAYGAKHRKVPTRSGYTFDHSSAVFLLDPNWSALPVVDPLRSGVSTHPRSARGRPEGFRAHVVRNCGSRRTEFARPSRSGRFWDCGGHHTWRSSL
jgi:protein SCO1